jgi:4-carboxymuconolactone decarboxylase
MDALQGKGLRGGDAFAARCMPSHSAQDPLLYDIELTEARPRHRLASIYESNLRRTTMPSNAREAFEHASLGAKNSAYDVVARLDPEYFEKLKGLYVDGTFGRDGALPRKTKELIMVGITCALRAPRGVRVHSERALALGATPREVLEAMEVAAIPGGMPGLWLGVEMLEAIFGSDGSEVRRGSGHGAGARIVSLRSSFASEPEDQRPCATGNPESDLLKPIERGGDRRDVPGTLRIEKKTQSAGVAELQRPSHATSKRVIQNEDGVPTLESESQYLGLPGSKIRHQRQHGGIGGGGNRDPRDLRHLWKADPGSAPFVEFSDNRRRHENGVAQPNEQVEQAKLMEILDRRGIADQLRQAAFRGRCRLGLGERYRLHNPQA